MKETYTSAVLDVIEFDNTDIILTSGDCEYDGYQPDCPTELPFD